MKSKLRLSGMVALCRDETQQRAKKNFIAIDVTPVFLTLEHTNRKGEKPFKQYFRCG